MTIQQDPERNEIRFLQKATDLADRHILEVGCGEGRLTWQYANQARSVVGIDLDADSLRVARLDRPSDLKDRVCVSLADSVHLPFSKESFDIALLAWSF